MKKTVQWQAHCLMPNCNWTSDITSQKEAATQVKQHLNDTAHPDYVPQTLWDMITEKDTP